MATAKKNASKAATGADTAPAVEKAPARKPRASAPRPTAKTIRNLRGTVVHARLLSQDPEKPFRIALQPRGLQGDTTTVPATLISDHTFVSGVDVLWEIITTTEARQVEYQPVGYLGRTDAPQVIRPEDTTIASVEDWDGKGRVPQQRTPTGRQASEREFGTGLHTTDVPGADAALHQQLRQAQKAGETAMPDGVDIASRQVVIERARG